MQRWKLEYYVDTKETDLIWWKAHLRKFQGTDLDMLDELDYPETKIDSKLSRLNIEGKRDLLIT